MARTVDTCSPIERFRMALPRRLRILLDCYIAPDPVWRLIVLRLRRGT